MDAARNLASDPALVQAKYEKMLEHQREWSSDRATAVLRFGAPRSKPISRPYMSATTSVARFGKHSPLTPLAGMGKVL